MTQFNPRRRTHLAAAVALALGGASLPVHAQIEAPTIENPSSEPMEEVVALGRTLSGAQSLINERMDDAVVTDMLGADAISRMGDSTVASALRRVPGLSLVGNKFVYIRGLGERYSASSLNGSYIPSPDLTRNVIPLDIFPTAIVESLRVQKAYSADMPANFGGGAVDVRTRGIPNQFTYLIEAGSGFNTFTDGDLLTYAGGGDDRFGTDDGSRALSQDLLSQINRFQGNTSVQGILNFLQRENPGEDIPVTDAQLVNREMGLELNRNIGLETRSSAEPDIDLKASVGNNFVLDENWELGFNVGGSYSNQWRNATTINRSFRFPDIRTDTERETTRSVNISGTLNLGLRFGDDHEVSSATLFLRNTDDETAARGSR
ncbi:MAG: TonB-dependent receptor plug domain-containing protein [Pseudomonadota bacterium]